jgi:hypothetical protein
MLAASSDGVAHAFFDIRHIDHVVTRIDTVRAGASTSTCPAGCPNLGLVHLRAACRSSIR